MDRIEYVYTAGMSEGELRERLEGAYAGVLSLADGNDAYAVPVSHHFDGDRLLFRLADDGDGEKLDYLAATEEATFVVYDVAGPGDAWSVVARGPVVAVEDLSAERINELFEPVHVFDESIQDVELRTYALEIRSLAGRRTIR